MLFSLFKVGFLALSSTTLAFGSMNNENNLSRSSTNSNGSGLFEFDISNDLGYLKEFYVSNDPQYSIEDLDGWLSNLSTLDLYFAAYNNRFGFSRPFRFENYFYNHDNNFYYFYGNYDGDSHVIFSVKTQNLSFDIFSGTVEQDYTPIVVDDFTVNFDLLYLGNLFPQSAAFKFYDRGRDFQFAEQINPFGVWGISDDLALSLRSVVPNNDVLAAFPNIYTYGTYQYVDIHCLFSCNGVLYHTIRVRYAAGTFQLDEDENRDSFPVYVGTAANHLGIYPRDYTLAYDLIYFVNDNTSLTANAGMRTSYVDAGDRQCTMYQGSRYNRWQNDLYRNIRLYSSSINYQYVSDFTYRTYASAVWNHVGSAVTSAYYGSYSTLDNLLYSFNSFTSGTSFVTTSADLTSGINLITIGLSGLAGLFTIYLLPGVSIGVLLFFPLLITMILFVVKLFKR